MKTDEPVKNVGTVEELTLQSLDRSLEGLESLRTAVMRCGDVMGSNPREGIRSLGEVAETIHDFYVFESDVCSLFQIDTERIRDSRGTLKTVDESFVRAMQNLMQRLGESDIPGLIQVLRVELPGLLDRFQDLLPALRNHIENEYLQPAY